MKTICSNDGARVSATRPSFTAKEVERGYPGSKSMVKAYVGHLRTTTADGSPPRSRKERAKAISPRALRWLLAQKREKLEKDDQAR